MNISIVTMVFAGVQGLNVLLVVFFFFRNKWYIKETQGLKDSDWLALPSFHRVYWSAWCWDIRNFLRRERG